MTAKLLKTLKKSCLAALAATLLTSVPAWAATLSAKAELDQPVVVQGDTRTVYVMVQFEADDEEINRADRPPLNLSLVLDRSGSMADAGKMEYLKRAAKLAVQQLSERDTLSIVEYDDAITVMVNPTRVNEHRSISRQIDELEPRGSTNLAGGLSQGVEEAGDARERLAQAPGTLTRVILMSDGLANVGETNPGNINRMVRNAKGQGIRVSSMGLGRDYDEDLMQAIAENGGGRYYYIEHPTQIARIFEEELASLFRTTARDCELTFEGSSAVQKAEIVGFEGTGRSLRQPVEDFYAGEKRSVLLRLDVKAGQTGSLDLGQLKVKYRPVKGEAVQSFTAPIAVSVTQDAAAAKRAINKTVSVEAALVEAERGQKAQVKLFEAGRRDEAAKNLSVLAKELESRNADLKDDRIKRKIESLSVENRQMTAAAAPAAQQAYLKASKNRLYQAKQGKRGLQQLQMGDKGIEVERLQEALKQAGHYQGKIDGVFDADVKTAVESYQRAQKTNQSDGVAGAETMDKLGIY